MVCPFPQGSAHGLLRVSRVVVPPMRGFLTVRIFVPLLKPHLHPACQLINRPTYTSPHPVAQLTRSVHTSSPSRIKIVSSNSILQHIVSAQLLVPSNPHARGFLSFHCTRMPGHDASETAPHPTACHSYASRHSTTYEPRAADTRQIFVSETLSPFVTYVCRGMKGSMEKDSLSACDALCVSSTRMQHKVT